MNQYPHTKYRLIIPTIILIQFILLLLFPPSQVQAQEFNLSIYPPLLRVNIKPGKSITQVFKITNNSSENRTLIARLVPFVQSDRFGNPTLNPSLPVKWLNYFSLANSNIKLNEPFEITGNSSDQLVVSLSVPDTAPLKDIYAALLVSTYNNDPNTDLQGSTIQASIASNLLITVNTQLSPPTILKITEFSPQKGSFLKIGSLYIVDNITSLSFHAVAKNEGDFTAETKGIFKIQRGDHDPIYLDSVLPLYVISKSERLLVNADDKSFNFHPTVGQIGYYQAKIELHSDNANTIGQIGLLFLPIKVIFGFLVGLSLLLIITNIAFQPQINN